MAFTQLKSGLERCGAQKRLHLTSNMMWRVVSSCHLQNGPLLPKAFAGLAGPLLGIMQDMGGSIMFV